MIKDLVWRRMLKNEGRELGSYGLKRHQVYPIGSDLEPGFFSEPRGDGFRLTRETPVASMGSCFAREIKTRLLRDGFNYVLTEDNHFSLHASCAWERVYSVANAAEILDYTVGQRFDADRLYEHDGRHWDLLRNKVVYDSREEAERDTRAHVAASRLAIERCELFILTIGQNEVWVDRETGRYYARRPPTPLVESGRAELSQLSQEANLSLLESFYQRFRAINPGAKVIFTLSPIPSTATFFEENVVVQSTLNKAILRVAIAGFTAKHPEISYFPSYEIVQTWRGNAFEPDNRHVKPKVVDAIMETFMAVYAG